MIELAKIAKHYQSQLLSEYGHLMKIAHHRALKQIIACHTPQAGAMLYHCDNCSTDTTFYPSCGHRHCPACQHNANSQWLDLQRQKLLPVDYYLATFTLPYQLRHFVWHHQKWAYRALFEAAKQTLDDFFENDKQLGESNGLLAVLHTHSRKLDFHPHVHFVVPAGGLHKRKMLWQQKTGKYLFNANNLAKVFRGKFIALMREAHYFLPAKTPTLWIVDCQHVGIGDSALTYLARYIYRGVISEKNILSLKDDRVTFQYKDSKTKQFKRITEQASAFLWRVLQHVLPKGFRRARNYGFMHGNAKQTLKLLQLILKVAIPAMIIKSRKPVCCPQCHMQMCLYLMRIGHRVIIDQTS